MTATEAFERRIDELCKENEQLREQVASLIDRSFRTADKIDCLNTENTKLRELVLHLYECAFRHSCTSCKYALDACDFEYDIRELGNEVD